jgi:hypothetical protein
VRSTARDTIKYFGDTLEAGIKELAGKPLTKEEEDKKKNDGIILMLLRALGKALGTVLVVGGTAALAAGEKMKK